jgi:hypothetical protein
LCRDNASGVFLGLQEVTAVLELGASGDEFSSRSAIETVDAAGAVGTRFE